MSDTHIKIMEAITSKRTIAALYNGTRLELAPHLIFERHGELFASALNLSKEWQPGARRHLGQFKIAGLSAAELLEGHFDPLPGFDGTPPRPGDVIVLAV
jgi:hypothetical protein